MNCDKENPTSSRMDFEDDMVLDYKGKEQRPWPGPRTRASRVNKAHLPVWFCKAAPDFGKHACVSMSMLQRKERKSVPRE